MPCLENILKGNLLAHSKVQGLKEDEFQKRYGNVFSFCWYLFEDLCKSVPFIGLPTFNLIKKFKCLVSLGVFILAYPYFEMVFKIINFLLIEPFFRHCNWAYDRISSGTVMLKETVNPSKSVPNIFLDSSRDLMSKLSSMRNFIECRIIRVGTVIRVVKYSSVLLALLLVFGLIYHFSSRIYNLSYGISISLISILKSLYGL